MCALSIASDGKRCVLESRPSDEGNFEVECQTSEAFASNKMLQEYIETDECVGACGVDRQSLGLSSDSLLDSKFIAKLCSHHCYNNCPNIVDLYSNVASAEGNLIPVQFSSLLVQWTIFSRNNLTFMYWQRQCKKTKSHYQVVTRQFYFITFNANTIILDVRYYKKAEMTNFCVSSSVSLFESELGENVFGVEVVLGHDFFF